MDFLKIEQLEKAYGAVKVFHNVNFSLERGCILGVVGPNGVGKSTLIKTLATIMRPSRGCFFLDGVNGVTFRHKVNRYIGYLGERAPLYTDLSIENFLLFMADLRGVPKKHRKEKVAMAMAETAVTQRRKLPISGLSRGWQQRVALAASILGDIKLLLLDEPSSGLDPLQSQMMRQLILKQKKENKSVIFSSHHIAEVEAICDQILLLDGDGNFTHFDWKKGVFLSSNFIDAAFFDRFFFSSFRYFIQIEEESEKFQHWIVAIDHLLQKNGFVDENAASVKKSQRGLEIFFSGIHPKDIEKKKRMNHVCVQALRKVTHSSERPIDLAGYQKPSLEKIFHTLHDGKASGQVGAQNL